MIATSTRREHAKLIIAAIEQYGPMSRLSLIAHTRLKTHVVQGALKYLREAKAIHNAARNG